MAPDTEADPARRVGALLVPGAVVNAAVVVAAVAVLVWPDPDDPPFVRTVGLGLVLLGLVLVWDALRRSGANGSGPNGGGANGSGQHVPAAAGSIGLLVGALGAAYLVDADDPTDELQVFAVLVAVVTIAGAIAARRRGGSAALAVVLGLVVAGVVGATPRAGAALLVGGLCLCAVVIGVTALWSATDPGRTTVAWGPTATARAAGARLREAVREPADRRRVQQALLFEGAGRADALARFTTLMALASAIATLGVIGDSTATVIGAMLVAPLMTPLMAIALSLGMGWPGRARNAATVVALGMAIAVGTGAILALVAPTVVDVTTNTQILSRISPTIVDLLSACAAGAAGAFAISRRDVADSLPGAAIAIALVPPLTVTGVGIAQGDLAVASGSLLLFATNAVAIVVVGGVTFVLTGVVPIERAAANQHRVRTATGAVAVAVGVVAAGLLLNGGVAARTVLEEATVADAVDSWLTDAPDHDLVRFEMGRDRTVVVIAGPSTGAPPAADLAADLADRLDRDVELEVRLVVEEIDRATAGG